MEIFLVVTSPTTRHLLKRVTVSLAKTFPLTAALGRISTLSAPVTINQHAAVHCDGLIQERNRAGVLLDDMNAIGTLYYTTGGERFTLFVGQRNLESSSGKIQRRDQLSDLSGQFIDMTLPLLRESVSLGWWEQHNRAPNNALYDPRNPRLELICQ